MQIGENQEDSLGLVYALVQVKTRRRWTFSPALFFHLLSSTRVGSVAQDAICELLRKMKVVLALALGASALAPSQQPKVSHPEARVA